MDKLLESERFTGNSLSELRYEAEHCTRCDLYKNATQTVFGEGSRDARAVLVGEQPGDKEDLAGRPFVGPAGGVLDKALVEAGIERDLCYVTNTVKHFKFEPRGKRRLHAKPNAGEIRICSWWLRGELELIKPKIVVALGATAANCPVGNTVRITKDRRKIFHPEGLPPVLVTIHPSYILRIRDRDQADIETREFIRDLTEIRAFLSIH